MSKLISTRSLPKNVRRISFPPSMSLSERKEYVRLHRKGDEKSRYSAFKMVAKRLAE